MDEVLKRAFALGTLVHLMFSRYNLHEIGTESRTLRAIDDEMILIEAVDDLEIAIKEYMAGGKNVSKG